MARALDEEPEAFWNKLEGALRPPQELTIKKRHGDTIRARVHASDADRGGVGGLTFIRVGDEWKIEAGTKRTFCAFGAQHQSHNPGTKLTFLPPRPKLSNKNQLTVVSQ